MPELDRREVCDSDVLMRIVALLVALAGLADRAAGLSGRRRRHLFEILYDAEAEGYEFLVGLMPPQSGQPDEPERGGDAARLAASFRVLALALYTMLQRRPSRVDMTAPRAGQGKPRRPALHCAYVQAYDTS